MGEGFGAHTAASHGSRPIGLPTKLLRSKRSAEEAAEPSANSMNPHRTSGVPLILPRGEVSCVRGGGGHLTCARALRSCAGGARPRGLECGVLCAEDVPVELEERTQQLGRGVTVNVGHSHLSSFGFHGRAWADGSSSQVRGWLVCYHPIAQPSASPIRWLVLLVRRQRAKHLLRETNKAVSLVTARRWRRTRPTTQRRRASQPDARCITREPSPRHPITAWASRTERTQVRPHRHSAHLRRQN